MVDNNLIILNSVLEQRKEEIAPDDEDWEFFEIFSFDQSTKEFELSYDELKEGSTGGPNDGGVDGFFFFIDGRFINEELELDNIKKYPKFDVFIIQAKRSNGFSEKVFNQFNGTAQDIFDFSKDLKVLKGVYNDSLLKKSQLFKDVYLQLAAKHPKINVHFVYACKGNADEINLQVENKEKNLIDLVQKQFPGSKVNVSLLGSKELLDLSRVERTYTLQLNFVENFLSKGEDNYVVLTSLEDYYYFISDEKGYLRRYIFDSNVRDFQGKVEVNQDIFNTLMNENKLDFWWLNNGITILASNASVSGSKTITLDNVQVINGLQTSSCIHSYMSDILEKEGKLKEGDKKRSLLVKVIILDENENEARDKIIKATNFQTSIQPASLKATERVHHNIEIYFKKHDWYYDRRKNYYKNIGKSANKIIGIPYLAQCMMSVVEKEPDTARSRPSSLVKSENIYSKLFNENINPQLYLNCAKIVRTVESNLKGDIKDFTSQEKLNLKFHISMVTLMNLSNKLNYSNEEIININLETITKEVIENAAYETIKLAREFMLNSESSLENTAKSRTFVDFIKENIMLSK